MLLHSWETELATMGTLSCHRIDGRQGCKEVRAWRTAWLGGEPKPAREGSRCMAGAPLSVPPAAMPLALSCLTPQDPSCAVLHASGPDCRLRSG